MQRGGEGIGREGWPSHGLCTLPNELRQRKWRIDIRSNGQQVQAESLEAEEQEEEKFTTLRMRGKKGREREGRGERQTDRQTLCQKTLENKLPKNKSVWDELFENESLQKFDDRVAFAVISAKIGAEKSADGKECV